MLLEEVDIEDITWTGFGKRDFFLINIKGEFDFGFQTRATSIYFFSLTWSMSWLTSFPKQLFFFLLYKFHTKNNPNSKFLVDIFCLCKKVVYHQFPCLGSS